MPTSPPSRRTTNSPSAPSETPRRHQARMRSAGGAAAGSGRARKSLPLPETLKNGVIGSWRCRDLDRRRGCALVAALVDGGDAIGVGAAGGGRGVDVAGGGQRPLGQAREVAPGRPLAVDQVAREVG